MWIILCYDVGKNRVDQIRKTCVPYLRWIQNSVFIGEITNGNLTILMDKLKQKIESSEDSVQIFVLRDQKLAKRLSLGISKEFNNII
ncbi:MAG: CRISPR-associated endonuclease Cas2 [Cuniculiplasma sp. C_DKE]|jgi:CRISPR-associated protein Cas2|nr:MAG: CRISPR-associated endonuclease Cas2 [Cuniculiplasma sp. C_DKE]